MALAGAVLGLWGLVEFRSLARASALDESRLVTSGVYARVRHPQHAGILATASGLANPDVLKFIPCYCGCGADHGSVKECFVREVRPDGSAVFDDMGLG